MHYAARLARSRPAMKGAWSGPAWQQADTLEIANFRPGGSGHRPRTYARLLYDSVRVLGTNRRAELPSSSLFWNYQV